MQNSETAPREANKEPIVEMKRTRWPKQDHAEDEIFRLVELPDGMKINSCAIVQAQRPQNRAQKPFSGTESENLGKPMGKRKIAPTEACGDGRGP